MQKTFILIGLIFVSVGLLWPLIQKFGIGHLPGDIHIQREGFSFYFPIVSCILVSALISVIMWLWNRF